jgi:hypothetical protein
LGLDRCKNDECDWFEELRKMPLACGRERERECGFDVVRDAAVDLPCGAVCRERVLVDVAVE